MKNIYSKSFLFICLLSLNCIIAQNVHRDYEDGKIWFKIKNNSNVTLETINTLERAVPNDYPIPSAILSQHAVTKILKPFAMLKSFELQRTYSIDFNSVNDIDAFITELQQLPFIEYAEKVPYNTASLTPNDPNYTTTDQWYHAVIKSGNAWDIGTGSSNVVVAIVDNAVQTNHVDLAANIWINPGEIAGNNVDDDNNGYIDDVNGFDVADGDNNPNPPNNTFTHGTHVAGCAAAVSNNSIGIASIGYSIKVMPVKVTLDNAANQVTISHGYEGVAYAIAAGADVISMSWGGYTYSTTSQNIMTTAYNQGIVLVVAAGNDSLSTPTYPAAYDHVIAVSNAKKNDVASKTSNFGTYIDVASPGTQIYSTMPGDTYGILSGTSMACPIVSGLCGLLLSINPNMTPDQVANCITSTADPMPNEPLYVSGQFGSGRINAYKAAQCAKALVGIETVANPGNELKAYVNGSGQLAVDFAFTESKSAVVSIYNQMGQQLIRKQFSSLTNEKEQFEISSFSNGVYIIEVKGTDFSYHSKFIK